MQSTRYSNPSLTNSPTRDFDVMWQAITHRARRAIMRLLAQQGLLCPREIERAFPGAQPTSVREHLHVLLRAGIVMRQRHPLDRRKICYSIIPSAIDRMHGWLAELRSVSLDDWEPPADDLMSS